MQPPNGVAAAAAVTHPRLGINSPNSPGAEGRLPTLTRLPAAGAPLGAAHALTLTLSCGNNTGHVTSPAEGTGLERWP